MRQSERQSEKTLGVRRHGGTNRPMAARLARDEVEAAAEIKFQRSLLRRKHEEENDALALAHSKSKITLAPIKWVHP